MTIGNVTLQYSLKYAKKKKENSFVENSNDVLRLFYNYLHSFNMCVRRTNVTVTNIQARTTNFFFYFFSLSSSLSLSSSVLFRLRRRMTMQHRAISIGRAYSTLTLFSSSSSFMTLALFFASLWSAFFFRAYRHRAYQWNFRTAAADASGDDINTHTHCAFHHIRVSSSKKFEMHIHTIEQIHVSFSFRLMSKNINFELARDTHTHKRQMMSFQTSKRIVVKGKMKKKKRREDTAGLIGRRISYTCASFVIRFSSSSSFFALIENRQKKIFPMHPDTQVSVPSHIAENNVIVC